MWSEDLDKKIREAAGNDIPGYNEKAWDSMEPLLDKHLPKEKKRRWLLLLFFSLLATGGAAFFILQRSSQTSSSSLSQSKETTIQPNQPVTAAPVVSPSTENTAKSNEPVSTAGSVKAADSNDPLFKSAADGDRRNIARNNDRSNQRSIPVLIKKDRQADQKNNRYITGLQKERESRIKKSAPVSPKKASDINTNKPDEEVVPADVPALNQNTSIPDNNNIIHAQSNVTTNSKEDTTTIKKNNALIEEPDTTQSAAPVLVRKEKKKNSKGSKLSINFSTGPDVSSIGIDKLGHLKMQYGIGVGYDLSDRLTIRTGFYASRKIYTADSADYHPPKSFWTYFDNLQTIDANCLVYEIPLNVVYRFPSSKNHNWFASAGLSSYLMKKETYGYSYKNSWNQPEYYSRSYKDENSHFFSVLSISGGYQYHFSERFSLMAEPYMKLPLSGVGFGKVKLNSGGLLFTVSLKPFAKKK